MEENYKRLKYKDGLAELRVLDGSRPFVATHIQTSVHPPLSRGRGQRGKANPGPSIDRIFTGDTVVTEDPTLNPDKFPR